MWSNERTEGLVDSWGQSCVLCSWLVALLCVEERVQTTVATESHTRDLEHADAFSYHTPSLFSAMNVIDLGLSEAPNSANYTPTNSRIRSQSCPKTEPQNPEQPVITMRARMQISSWLLSSPSQQHPPSTQNAAEKPINAPTELSIVSPCLLPQVLSYASHPLLQHRPCTSLANGGDLVEVLCIGRAFLMPCSST
jgi:hypothetical protein